MNGSGKTLIGLLEQVANGMGSLDAIAEALGARPGKGGGRVGTSSLETPSGLNSGSPEIVATRYSVGRGQVRADGRGLSVEYDLFSPDGRRIGSKLITGEVQAESPDQLRAPSYVTVSFGETGSVPDTGATVLLKAKYTFDDGSTITGIGKGVSQLINLSSGRAVLADAAVVAVAGGTGQYEGARGIVSVIGLVVADSEKSIPFGQPGATVQQTSVDTFRIFKGSDVAR